MEKFARFDTKRNANTMTKPGNAHLPLARNCLFQSSNLDEARAIVAQKFCDHRLDRVARSDQFDAVHNRVEGRATSLNFIRYGADVEIEPGELNSFYLIQVPLTGHASIDNSAGNVETGPGLGSVLNPHRHTSMRWREGCSQLLLQVDAAQLQKVAERLLGRALARPVTFETAVDQHSSKIGQWVQQLRTCFALADKEAVFAGSSLHTQALVEEQLIESFLLCQPSDISDLVPGDVKQAANVHVRRAMSYIHDNLGQPLTIGDVSLAVGVSARSLQLGFKSELGQTPMQYLREARLSEARHLIRNSPADEKIGDICQSIGFGHFGRFSVEYRQRFGESPHETRAKLG